MQRTHHQLLIRLDGRDSFLLWFHEDGQDGVVATPDEHVLTFGSETTLLEFARELRVTLSEHRSVVHDLDPVQAWARAPTSASLNPRELLVAWNLFGDVARSVPTRARGFLAEDAGKDKLYDKLFLASKPDPVALASGGGAESSALAWSSVELSSLAALLLQGVAMMHDARARQR